jgi:thioredoxin-like negative regulator of GroEL
MKTLQASIAVLLVAWAGAVIAAPYTPQSGAQVIETLPSRSNAQQLALQAMRRQLAAAPNDLALAAKLAQRYIALGRSETDPRYFGYAQAALAPWWHAVSPPAEVRLLRATLLQNTHRFGSAMEDLNAAVAAAPDNAQAWLTRATVQTVIGDYAGATASCARLSSMAEQLASITCIANTVSVSGRLDKSEQLLAATLRRNADSAPELRTWSLTLLAEMAARRGDAGVAEARFREALQSSPRDSYLLGAYADLLLDQQRPREVLELLDGQRRIDALLLRHAIALKRLGNAPAELAAQVKELQARFHAAAQRGDSVHQREQARFELELMQHNGNALALAQSNWQVQKEPADMRILLEAAVQARKPDAAAPVLQWIARHGVEDVALASLSRKLGAGS